MVDRAPETARNGTMIASKCPNLSQFRVGIQRIGTNRDGSGRSCLILRRNVGK